MIKTFTVCAIALSISVIAYSQSYGIFSGVDFHYCYDGDTCTFTIPNVHPLLGKRISVRIKGIDTPEIRGKCDKEKELAKRARDFLINLLKGASRIDLVGVQRGKYFRIIAAIQADGTGVSKLLIENGYARKYEGGTRKGWCEN